MKHPLKHIWYGMRNRCLNPKDSRFKSYGGRGIKISSRWDKFENFSADMGERPQGTSLDRIDMNGDYSKENCRWATRVEQANNMRSNRVVTYKNKSQTVAQWGVELGINANTLNKRLVRGNWEPSKAFSLIPKKRRYSLTYKGRTLGITEWARLKGLKVSTLRMRLDSCKWSVARSLNTPVIR